MHMVQALQHAKQMARANLPIILPARGSATSSDSHCHGGYHSRPLELELMSLIKFMNLKYMYTV